MSKRNLLTGWVGALAMCAGLALGTNLASAAEEKAEQDKPKAAQKEARKEAQKEGENAAKPKPKPRPEGEKGEARRPGRPGAEGPGALLAGLDLTDAQKEQIKTITDEARKEHEAWREKNKDAFAALREKHKAARDSDDREKLKDLKAEHETLMQGAPDRKAVMGKIMAVLNPEQQEKVQARRKELEARREQMKKEAGPRPDGEKPGKDAGPDKKPEKRGEGEGKKPGPRPEKKQPDA